MAGQKILFSGRVSSVWKSKEGITISNGATIKTKTHAEIETIVYLSITGAEPLGRPNVDASVGKSPPSPPGFMRC